LTVYLPEDKSALIESGIWLSSEKRINQFQVFWITDPYKSLLKEKNEVQTKFVFGSPRIAIDTR